MLELTAPDVVVAEQSVLNRALVLISSGNRVHMSRSCVSLSQGGALSLTVILARSGAFILARLLVIPPPPFLEPFVYKPFRASAHDVQ